MALRTRLGRPLTVEEQKRLDAALDKHLNRVRPHAEPYVVRSYLIGKLRKAAEVAGLRYEDVIELSTLPTSIAGAVNAGIIAPWERKALEAMEQVLASHITDISDSLKQDIRQMVLKDRMGNEEPRNTARRMFHRFGAANKDWRRIAVTESGFASEAAYLSKVGSGKHVIGIGLPGMCPECREKIHGKVYKVVEPDADGKDWDAEVWAGKTNIGRSSSARKRVGIDPETGRYILEPRPDHERTKPAIPLHASCLLPGNLVYAPDMEGCFTALYSGPVVEIRLSDGRLMTITDEHLFLTPRGWACARSLRSGDVVFDGSAFQRPVRSDPGDYWCPPQIEDVVGAFPVFCPSVSAQIPVSPEHLHGAAAFMKGEILVVKAIDLLGDAGQAAFPGRDLFSARNGKSLTLDDLRDFATSLKRLADAADRIMGGRIEARAFLPDSERGPGVLESSGMTTAEVWKVRESRYAGPVYDLQTWASAYLCNGIVSSNCRCRWQEFDPETQAVDPVTGFSILKHDPVTKYEDFVREYGQEGLARVHAAINRLKAATVDPETFERELAALRAEAPL